MQAQKCFDPLEVNSRWQIMSLESAWTDWQFSPDPTSMVCCSVVLLCFSFLSSRRRVYIFHILSCGTIGCGVLTLFEIENQDVR